MCVCAGVPRSQGACNVETLAFSFLSFKTQRGNGAFSFLVFQENNEKAGVASNLGLTALAALAAPSLRLAPPPSPPSFADPDSACVVTPPSDPGPEVILPFEMDEVEALFRA